MASPFQRSSVWRHCVYRSIGSLAATRKALLIPRSSRSVAFSYACFGDELPSCRFSFKISSVRTRNVFLLLNKSVIRLSHSAIEAMHWCDIVPSGSCGDALQNHAEIHVLRPERLVFDNNVDDGSLHLLFQTFQLVLVRILKCSDFLVDLLSDRLNACIPLGVPKTLLLLPQLSAFRDFGLQSTHDSKLLLALLLLSARHLGQ